jgi:hypothetical protein
MNWVVLTCDLKWLTSHVVDMLCGPWVDWVVVVEAVDEHIGWRCELIGQPFPVRGHPLADRGVVPSEVQVQQLGVGVRDATLVVDWQEEVWVWVSDNPPEWSPPKLFDYVSIRIKQS